jgi:hypothetical protein
MTKGIPVVQTPAGEIPLRDMIAEWIKAGEGQIFLPQHRAEQPDNSFARQLRRVTS